MAQSKATKKFEKNHLQDTLKRRKEFAKVKQRHQQNAKKKARRAEERSDTTGGDAEPTAKKAKQEKDAFNDMSVDDFFAGGFEVPKQAKKGKSVKRAGKRKRTEGEEDDDVSSVESVEEHAALAGSIDGDESDEDSDKGEIGAHKEDLEALKEKDPEFYNYLKNNDAELLDFAEDSNLPEVDELSGSESEITKGKSVKAGAAKEEATSGAISRAIVKKWITAMTEQNSLRSMRELVLAFRAAAHLNEEEGKDYKYTIADSDVYHDVISGALKHIPSVLNYHLPAKELSNGRIRVPTESKKFRTLSPLLKSHTTSVLHLLETLTDSESLKLALSSILSLIPYTLSFKKLVRDLSRSVAGIWSTSTHNEAIRISAFLVLRRLVVVGDPGIKENVLRSSYQGLIQGSRNTTIHNLPGINLMKNSASELWGLADVNSIAYTTAFSFIRQLAIHLRNSIKHNANEAYKAIYNWQYIHSLDFWSRVLSTHCDALLAAKTAKTSPLQPLIYPLVQTTLGALRLIPTAAYFPLRIHLTRALLRISQTTHTFIPLAAPLLEVLQSAEMKKPPRPTTLKPLDFEVAIRAPKSYLRTRVYQDSVGEHIADCLAEFFNLWSRNVAFPELALPTIVMLKRWLKEVSPFRHATNGNTNSNGRSKKPNADNKSGGNRNSKVNGMVTLLVQKLDANARWVEERRSKLEFAPNNRSGVEGFLKDVEWTKTPLGAFVQGTRKAREERRKMLEEARREEDRKKKEDRKRVADVEMDGDGEDVFGSDDEESEPEPVMEFEDEDDELELEDEIEV